MRGTTVILAALEGQAPSPPLSISTAIEESGCVIRVEGELDLAGCPKLGEALESAQETAGGAILVDLEELTFIDAAAMEYLLLASRRSASNGNRLRITQGSAPVARMFRLTGLDAVLPLVPAQGT